VPITDNETKDYSLYLKLDWM